MSDQDHNFFQPLRDIVQGAPTGRAPSVKKLFAIQRRRQRQRQALAVGGFAVGVLIGIVAFQAAPRDRATEPREVAESPTAEIPPLAPHRLAKQGPGKLFREPASASLAEPSSVAAHWMGDPQMIPVRWGDASSPLVVGIDPRNESGPYPVFLAADDMAAPIPVGYVHPPRVHSVPLWRLSPDEQQRIRNNWANAGFAWNPEM